MRPNALVRRCAIVALGTVLAVGAPASSHPADRWSLSDLPFCGSGSTARRAAGTAPTSRPRLDDSAACRIAASRVTHAPGPRGTGPAPESAPATGTGRVSAGYRHLGAGTAGEWSGVSGRLTVTDPAVRADSYDFLAARFMAKRRATDGSVAWLEAGWAETGWSGDGRQRIYTYDTNRRTWRFYDEFALRPGDQVWLDVHADADGVWQAWLWWDERWNLLSSETLPIGATAHIEQYVELHVDTDRPTRLGAVPPVAVHDVHLVEPDGSAARPWRADVETVTGNATEERSADLCLDWTTRYDTWSAGDCPAPADSPDVEPSPAAPPPSPPAPVTSTASTGSDAADSGAAHSGRTHTGPTGPVGGTPGGGAATDRPRAAQPADARPVDEEPASIVGTPAPTPTQRGLLRPLLGR
jgi:hypothetical protein